MNSNFWISIDSVKSNPLMINKTLRLINFIIDTGIYLTLMITFLIIFRNLINQENAKWISIAGYFLYYFLFEYFKGQTIGKIITKSVVVSLTGKRKNLLVQILGRTLMRFIPIDIVSYLFSTNGLHDRISKTTLNKVSK
jgi:uncharacterized RDD family membrane protein YckC